LAANPPALSGIIFIVFSVRHATDEERLFVVACDHESN
jgi:hypothetical protein